MAVRLLCSHIYPDNELKGILNFLVKKVLPEIQNAKIKIKK